MQINPDGAKIRRWREERCWSQEHLAEVAGIGLRTVQRVENGDGASRESLMALAVAFDVDALALTVDPKAEAAKAVRAEKIKGIAALRLSFWIGLACYGFGVILFIVISVVVGSFVMKWALLWWTVGVAGYGLAVVIAELVTRHERLERS